MHERTVKKRRRIQPVHVLFIPVPDLVQVAAVASAKRGLPTQSWGEPAEYAADSPRQPRFTMRRLSTELPFTCVTCEQEIRGRAVFHVGLPFCCAGCVADGPCLCSYDEPAAVEAHTGDPAILQPAAAEEELALAAR